MVGGCGEEQAAAELALRAARVFDGERLIVDGIIAVGDGRIVAVGPAGEIDVEAERTIELGDATILPGLIDLHVHTGELSPQLLLATGLTTVRDLGMPLESLAQAKSLTGELRVIAAGPIITTVGGYPIPVHGPTVALEINGAADAERAVTDLIERGAAVVKIAVERGFDGSWPALQLTEIKAIVASAHEHDLEVVAHVTRTDDARLALRGGVDQLAHMPCIGADAGLMQDLAAAEVAIIGTLHVEETFSCPGSLANARAFVEAGGELLYGSDIGNPGIPLGIDPQELKLLRAAGLSPVESLRAATAAAADLLGDTERGRLRKGYIADILAVRGNPLTDLEALRSVELVLANGDVIVVNGRLRR